MVDIPLRWTRVFNGHTTKRLRNSILETRRRREAIRELQNIWIRLVFNVIGSTEGLDPVVLGMTSAVHGEGKTTNCLGIGSALANETGAKVIVLECDLGNSGLASLLDLDPRPGLADCVTGSDEIKGLVHHTRIANLDVVVAGGQEGDDLDSQNWTSAALRELRRKLPDILGELRQDYRYVLLDMPPVLENVYTQEMIGFTNGTFLVVRAGVTPLESMKRAAGYMGDATLLGVILGGADSPLPEFMIQLLTE